LDMVGPTKVEMVSTNPEPAVLRSINRTYTRYLDPEHMLPTRNAGYGLFAH
jgi:hypothetical protein